MFLRVSPGWSVFWCLAWLSCVSLGCATKKEPRYPEDHNRFVRIDAAVERLRTAYVEKNLSDIEQLMVPLDRLETLGQDIRDDFQTFEEISLDLSIDRITVDGDTIEVFVHWQGRWKRTPTEAEIRDRGHGMLRWIGVQSILLQHVQGDLPFGMANRVRGPGAGPF